jgi:hypothetical protein
MAGNTNYFNIQYPTSTDYVKDGAVAIETVADGFDSAVAIPTYNNQTGTTYTFVLLDAAKVVSSNNASAVTFTIPPQASVVWETGTTLTVANYGAGAVTIAGGAGVTVTNSTATVSQYGSASIIRTASNAWTVIPFAGGAALLSDSAISGTTGSPIPTSFTSGGINYKAYAFTGSGTITFNKAGLIDVLCIAGGGGGGSDPAGLEREGGGGAGGYMNTISSENSGGLSPIQPVYVSAIAHTVTIGAGGSGANDTATNGTPSFISSFTSVGGGRGATVPPARRLVSFSGGSGGGGAQDAAHQSGAVGLKYQGFAGGNGGTTFGGGGGGAGAVGATGSGTTGGNGGAGLSSSINGTATTRGGGGGGAGATPGSGGAGGGGAASAAGTGTAGSVNTGGGGGAGRAAGGAGGSGIVIVRVLA